MGWIKVFPARLQRSGLMEEVYDAVVVGAGVEGSSTAYHLVRKGVKRVLLLEQFDALHTRGSSHGSSRITRRAYNQPYYVHMMDEAFKLWEQIEQQSGTKLYHRTGILVFGSHNSPEVEAVRSSLSVHGVEHEVFSGAEANRRFPEQLKLPSDYQCVFEKDGGILLASKAVAAIQHLFKKNGGKLLDQHQVTDIVPGSVVTVVTNKAMFSTRKVVVTAGAWAPAIARKLGLELPFRIVRAEIHYWTVDHPEKFSSKVFPIFVCYQSRDRTGPVFFYGMPVHEYPGLIKISRHYGLEIDPDHRDANPVPVTTEEVSHYIETFIKGVSTTPSIFESCMYTESPDEDPVLDRHPHHQNIIFGAGFSGHGFKLSPVVGKILSELALDLPPSYDLTPFRVDRFTNTSL